MRIADGGDPMGIRLPVHPRTGQDHQQTDHIVGDIILIIFKKNDGLFPVGLGFARHAENPHGLGGHPGPVKVLHDLPDGLHLLAFIHGIQCLLASAFKPDGDTVETGTGHQLTCLFVKGRFGSQIGVPDKGESPVDDFPAETLQIGGIDDVIAEVEMIAAVLIGQTCHLRQRLVHRNRLIATGAMVSITVLAKDAPQ